MNLYCYSQDNNIEAGVMTKATLLDKFVNNLKSNAIGEDGFDAQAFNYFKRVIDQSELLFSKKPQYEDRGVLLNAKYIESQVEIDKLSEFFEEKSKSEFDKPIPKKIEIKISKQPTQTEKQQYGFCIRTGVSIPFNIEKPLSYGAYKEWKVASPLQLSTYQTKFFEYGYECVPLVQL